METKTELMDRRDFIGLAAAGLGALSLGMRGCNSPRAVAPSDWVHVGVIGVGSRGQHMMRMLLRVPGVQITGLCDIYEPRIAEGRRVTGEQTTAYSDYRKMLEARDIDAVLVATPLGLHAEHVIAALDSGRPVYGEKSMGRTLQDCNRIRDEVRRTGKIYQVGLQFMYAPWYREALRRIGEGRIGQVTQMFSCWHRNNNWRRPVPPDGGLQLERLLNWRLYRELSGGLLAELGSHQINFANTVFNAMPESAMASGGVDYWKDGREIDDNVHAILRYPGGQTLEASYITTNRLDGAQERVFGTGGSVVLTHTEATYYEEPWYPNSAIPPEMKIEHKLITGPTYSAEQPYHGKGDSPSKGSADDVDLRACQGFIDCIRNHRRPLADENAGWSEGVAVALCNRALEEGRKITLSEFLGSAAS
jgi:predicted dehydrogenase